jgi:hypothetical protein
MSSIFEPFLCLNPQDVALSSFSRRFANRQTVRTVVTLSVHLY